MSADIKEKEPRPWSEVQSTHSDLPEPIQDAIEAAWLSSSQTAPLIGELARKYEQDWTQVWRFCRMVIPARQRKTRAAAARAKRAAEKKKNKASR